MLKGSERELTDSLKMIGERKATRKKAQKAEEQRKKRERGEKNLEATRKDRITTLAPLMTKKGATVLIEANARLATTRNVDSSPIFSERGRIKEYILIPL